MVESTNDLDATQLLYFGNTYLFRAAAKVISRFVEEDGRLAVVLSSTVFYPQGGGQPSDVGTITSGKSSFQVEDVRCKQVYLVKRESTCSRLLEDVGCSNIPCTIQYEGKILPENSFLFHLVKLDSTIHIRLRQHSLPKKSTVGTLDNKEA
mmetsp:Transcript_20391/g.28248  ORF Transcript_20391/g.28248 Transcript_20391/m.28248 type:complete len:151 (+) Transcript_20391:137-589(+)